ncbi:MAG: hypothetical protein WDO19_21720 [Bacteroidota bacterium]
MRTQTRLKTVKRLIIIKRAAGYFEEDNVNSPEYLFLAAYFADKVLKNRKSDQSLSKN